MGTVSIGPGLAGFPAFPLLPLDALANPAALTPEQLAQIQGTFAALGFQFTNTSFRFQLDSSVFGVAGSFLYTFEFEGDFSALAADPLALFAAFNPQTAANYLIRFQSAETYDALNDRLAISAVADTAGPPIPFALFFSTLLDPRNFTENLLQTFTGGQLGQFSELDLSAFTAGVISGRANGATVAREGTISRPDGSFIDSEWGVVSFDGEIRDLSFTKVVGGTGDDILAHNASNALIIGGGGNDLLVAEGLGATASGGAGRDVLVAAATAARLEGDGSDDVLVGDRTTATLIGGAGNDIIHLAGGSATGGDGSDRFIIDRGTVARITDFNPVADRLVFDLSPGQARSLSITASAGGVLVTARDGLSVLLEGLSPADIRAVRGAVDLDERRQGVGVADLDGQTLSGGSGNNTLIGRSGDDRLVGNAGDDRLIGGAGNDRLLGNNGSDILFGGAGDDRLMGGSGDDVLDGGDGEDVLIGGSGFDVLTGAAGADRFVLSTGPGYDRITDFELGVDAIDLSDLFNGIEINAQNFAEFVRVRPLGPTELTGFVEVDLDGAAGPGDWQIVAQIDGAPFAIINGQSTSRLALTDFVFG
jgi:Ca2+-binding RTX toxin-like protein